MSQIVFDIGSGNTLTDEATAIRLIDEIVKRDTKKHEVIFKTQLFKSAPPNKPLNHKVFMAAWSHAQDKGYRLTSSVFDLSSLEFLMKWDLSGWRLPFIKIACRPDLYWLMGEVPRRVKIYYSIDARWDDDEYDRAAPYAHVGNTTELQCVREYPAKEEDYWGWGHAVSDHTEGWDFFNSTLSKEVWEKHICLERSPDNPDSGLFAVLPSDLEGVL